MNRLLLTLVTPVLVMLAISPAQATTYVMMSDGALADGADVIAFGQIEAQLPSDAQTVRHVDYRFRVDQLVKGDISSPEQTVRILGGGLGGERALFISDAPRFARGERALLFLSRGEDGILRPFQFALGAFHVADSEAGLLAIRHLDPGGLIGTAAASAESGNQPRSLEPFLHWLRDRVGGIERTVNYLTDAAPIENPQARFTQFGTESVKLRWFEFDNGQTVTWRAVAGGQSGTTFDEFLVFEDALWAWTDEPDSTITFDYGGTVASDPVQEDGVNAIKWNDPDNEIAGSFDCTSGGTLAIGGAFFRTTETRIFAGRPYYPILEGFIVVQDNAACFFNGNSGANGEEVFAHELGHTLGFDHSCGDERSGPCDGSPPGDSEALMRAFAHGDGRGAALGEDDIAARLYVYPENLETLSTTVDGLGSIVSDPPGIDCAGALTSCEALFGRWLVVRPTATPELGHQFLGWTGDCSGTDSTISVEMYDSLDCTANFINDRVFESSFEAD